MNEPKEDQAEPTTRAVDTGGGPYIEGTVDTGGGDFVAHDKIVHRFTSMPSPRRYTASEMRRPATRRHSPFSTPIRASPRS